MPYILCLAGSTFFLDVVVRTLLERLDVLRPDLVLGRLVINIDAAGHYFAGEQPLNSNELAAHLRARFHNAPPLKLQVRADASTPVAKIKNLMHLAAEAGALEVVYGVRAQ